LVRPAGPILVLIDASIQSMIRRDELLGLNEYFGHLIKVLALATLRGHRTIALVHGPAAGGALIATALATQVLLMVPGAEPSVMDSPEENGAFVAAMEDVLFVYTRPHDPDRPLVCLDETTEQLTKETRAPVPMKKGQPARFDYEYERNGTANMFMMFAPLEGWRHVKVTGRRTAVNYAHALKDLSDVHFPDAKTIVLVQDNLSTHTLASLYEAFPAAEARRLVERFEWHYTRNTAVGST
jgi:Malonate decarboxylase gamma subunit (MdcE)/DDE superfamily endonuclease